MGFNDGLSHESDILRSYPEAAFNAETSRRSSYFFDFFLFLFFDQAIRIIGIWTDMTLFQTLLWDDRVVVCRIEIMSNTFGLGLFSEG